MTQQTTASQAAVFAATRRELHRIATHVLARGRWQAGGRFGLRAVPNGVATPAFGPRSEVLRLTPLILVREQQLEDGARTEAMPLSGASIEEMARFAGVDLDAEFSVGRDSPPLGDRHVAVEVVPAAAAGIFDCFDLGARVLDAVLATSSDASIVQLWPEHFDVAVDVAVGSTRANLGASPGDGFHDRPYVYVGPWGAERPGDPDYWNAPFGALLGVDQLRAGSDPQVEATSFLRRGLDLLRGGAAPAAGDGSAG